METAAARVTPSPIHDQSPPTKTAGRQCSDPGPGKESHGEKSPRHASVKKPSKTIKQKRAAKKLKLEQVTRHDVMAAVHDR